MAPHPCLLLLQTALHLAAILEEASAVEKLYAAGSSVLVAERGGHTALHLACRVGAHACPVPNSLQTNEGWTVYSDGSWRPSASSWCGGTSLTTGQGMP